MTAHAALNRIWLQPKRRPASKPLPQTPPEIVRHPQQGGGGENIAQAFADRHVAHAGPERDAQPAGQSAQRVADARQPGQQQHRRAAFAHPAEVARAQRGLAAARRAACRFGMRVRVRAVAAAQAVAQQRHLGAVAHPPVDDAAQGVAQRGDGDHLPEQVGPELDVGEYGGFGTQRQQRGGYQADHENGRQAHFGQGQGSEQPV